MTDLCSPQASESSPDQLQDDHSRQDDAAHDDGDQVNVHGGGSVCGTTESRRFDRLATYQREKGRNLTLFTYEASRG